MKKVVASFVILSLSGLSACGRGNAVQFKPVACPDTEKGFFDKAYSNDFTCRFLADQDLQTVLAECDGDNGKKASAVLKGCTVHSEEHWYCEDKTVVEYEAIPGILGLPGAPARTITSTSTFWRRGEDARQSAGELSVEGVSGRSSYSSLFCTVFRPAS